jgi:hypothetical protein
MKSKRKRVSTIHEEDEDLREIGKKEIVRKRKRGNGLFIYLNE